MNAEIELGSALFVGHGATLLPNSLIDLALGDKRLWVTKDGSCPVLAVSISSAPSKLQFYK